MSKAWAKILLRATGHGYVKVKLITDMGTRGPFDGILVKTCVAPQVARAWSRRLGNIPVEVEE